VPASPDVESERQKGGAAHLPESETLEVRLKKLMFLRLVLVTTLLLVAAYFEAQQEFLGPVNPLYFLIGATYGLTVLHALGLRFLRRPRALAYAQVVGDLLVVSGIVWVTGETRAGFMLLYPISVLSGSVLLFRTGGLILAGTATGLYASLLATVRLEILPPVKLLDVLDAPPETLFYWVFVTGVQCVTVALIGSYLASSLHSVGEQLEEAEEQVADLQELNEAIVSSMHSGLLTADATGRALHVNPFGELILGRSGSEIRGRPLEEVFDSSALEASALRIRGANASLARIELPYTKPGAEQARQLGISVWPLNSPSLSAGGHLLAFQDLTEIKRLEDEVRLKEKLAAVGEMAAQLAHEIRNPLGSISGSAQMLLGEARSAQERQLLSIITRESKRLSEALNRFLFEARSPTPVTGPVDIGPLIEQAVTLLRNSPEVGERRVVELEVDRGPFLCMADPDQISQVFWNLARNGLEAMAEGGVLTVRLRRLDADLALSFHDQGPGFERDERRQLFEPFRSGRPMGTGLGLAIVYRIVRQHSGDISVRSSPSRGTVVEVRLPLVKEAVSA
jgi:two-component system, NtrC family, sensor histidine kinase PilS